MGRAILVLVVAMGILFSMSSLRMANVSLSSADNANTNYEENNARNIAKSGVELAMMQLDSNKYWRTGYNNLSLANGTLTLTAQAIDSSNIRVRSTGTYQGVSKLIVATIYLPTTNGGVPACFGPGIMCDQSITLNGNVTIPVYYPAMGYNANIHANDAITLNGNVNVQGYASFTTGSCQANPPSKLNQFLTPNVIIPGQPLARQVPRINIPPLNADSLKPFCDEQYPGDYTVSGNKTLGTATNPRKIYVGGSLTWNGNVTGYGIFIVKGSVTFNGNVTCNYPPPATIENLAIYAMQDVTFNGNIQVTAQVLTYHSLTLNGNVTLVGGAICSQSITLNGNCSLKYLPVNATLTSFCWNTSTPSRPDLTSYWE